MGFTGITTRKLGKKKGKHVLRGYECGTHKAPGVAKANQAKRKGKRNFKRAS